MISKTNQTKFQITTAEQLFALPDDGKRYELVRGNLRMMSPAGNEHGWIAGRILARLAVHVEKLDLGRSYAAETGFRISSDPDTVRAPDACFVSHENLRKVEATKAYLSLAPDLVVEVFSPNDSSSEVEANAEEWLNAGSQVVLVADPGNETIRVYQDKSQIRVLRRGETFDAGDACAGWRLSVNEVFEIKA